MFSVKDRPLANRAHRQAFSLVWPWRWPND